MLKISKNVSSQKYERVKTESDLKIDMLWHGNGEKGLNGRDAAIQTIFYNSHAISCQFYHTLFPNKLYFEIKIFQTELLFSRAASIYFNFKCDILFI